MATSLADLIKYGSSVEVNNQPLNSRSHETRNNVNIFFLRISSILCMRLLTGTFGLTAL